MTDAEDREGIRAEVFGVDEQSDSPVDVARWVRLAEAVLDDEGVRGESEMSLLFVDEQSISELNEQFMGTNSSTDVLAFPIDDDPMRRGRSPDSGSAGPSRDRDVIIDLPQLLGDVVVCPAVAARQATERGTPLDNELALLVVHGILHLLGHDHFDDDEAATMKRRERELLDKFFATP